MNLAIRRHCPDSECRSHLEGEDFIDGAKQHCDVCGTELSTQTPKPTFGKAKREREERIVKAEKAARSARRWVSIFGVLLVLILGAAAVVVYDFNRPLGTYPYFRENTEVWITGLSSMTSPVFKMREASQEECNGQGGATIFFGADIDDDNRWEEGEYKYYYVCNGATGPQGPEGPPGTSTSSVRRQRVVEERPKDDPPPPSAPASEPRAKPSATPKKKDIFGDGVF